MLFLICLAGLSGSIFLKEKRMAWEEEKEFIQVQKLLAEAEKDEEKLSALTVLTQEYPECIGYLEIRDTRISYPIMQNSDNEYYLYRAMDGEASRAGCIYMDSNHTIGEKGLHSIYGHNMKNGTMFKDITRFTDREYMEAHQEISIRTAERQIRLKPVYCYAGKEDSSYRSRLADPAQVSGFIEDHTGRVMAADDLYVFITCSYGQKEERIYLYCIPWPYAFDGGRMHAQEVMDRERGLEV